MQPYSHVDISVCSHVSELACEAWTMWGETVLDYRVLRRLEDGRLRSASITVPNGWSGTIRAGSSVTQVFLRSGSLDLSGRKLGQHGFFVLGEGLPLPASALEATELLVILDHECTSAGAPDSGLLVIDDLYALEPTIPVIEGRRLDGFEIRWPWVNPETGADTMFIEVPAGFQGGGPNFHPVQEEIFCLAGDIQPDDTRPMRAGSFLWNPKQAVHGFNEFSRGGATLLEWHDGQWNLFSAPGVTQAA